ncbi:MAG: prolipoprotein diacylglyceryl transferase [Clostridiaceae bacterium]|nr:prolipoprotein diacylglyceryl transferase [Clostridiaceae bacterium]
MGVYFIEFPKLGIRLNIGPVAFQIGQIKVHWYGIIIACAIMVALTLAMRQSKKFNINEEQLLDMFLYALPVSIIFARLFFVVFSWNSYKNDLLGIFRIWEGGLAIYGAIIGAVLTVFFFCRARKIDVLEMCDFACVYLPLAQAIGRWGNFTNQELYGSNTDLPWGMTGNIIQASPDPGVDGSRPVHPTFLYESILNLIVFAILLRLREKKKVKGTVFASYLMAYSAVRTFMEFFRVDDFGTGNIRYNQVFSVLVFIGALTWFIYLNKRHKKAIEEAEEALEPSPYADIVNMIREEEESASGETNEITEDSGNEAGGNDEDDAFKDESPEEKPEAGDQD